MCASSKSLSSVFQYVPVCSLTFNSTMGKLKLNGDHECTAVSYERVQTGCMAGIGVNLIKPVYGIKGGVRDWRTCQSAVFEVLHSAPLVSLTL